MKKIVIFFALTLVSFQTIEEKKASFQKSDSGMDVELESALEMVNVELEERHFRLKKLYEKGEHLFNEKAKEEEFAPLVSEIKKIRSEIASIEEMWRASVSQKESYSLWQQNEASLQQLIVDYGSGEYLYIIPQEIASLKITIQSKLPIPRESWEESLLLILSQNGIGVRQLNPYLREVYPVTVAPSRIARITSDISDLALLPGLERVCFVLIPDTPDPNAVLKFLQRFSNQATTTFEVIRGEIFIFSTVDSIKELLKLYDFVKSGTRQQDYQIISLNKIDGMEAALILDSAFKLNCEVGSDLKAIPLTSLSRSLFVFGSKEEVSKAIKLIKEIEEQMEDAKEKSIFWYTVKHSKADELAATLAKVYDLLVGEGSKSDLEVDTLIATVEEEKKEQPLIVEPKTITPHTEIHSHKTLDRKNNFIVDEKTGSIIMVVQQEALPKIKELLKKLDVPKKMVQIEVLLFEKKFAHQNRMGLNLLRLGDAAKNLGPTTGLSWGRAGSGILEFFISRGAKSGIPAFDLAYHFLLGQDNIQINACPSITTVNQTPATIAIVEEISINTGVDVEKEVNTYSRAQYGITIQITPTINVGEDEEDLGFITLDTDITFDTTKKNVIDRPDVTRRHIKNHVRIGDGQTVILGGLRRKSCEGSKECIPFLGEIPGIGKLFSTTQMQDSSTEMFVFITPKILEDCFERGERKKREELAKRPGDLPEFLHVLNQAKQKEKKRLFEETLASLFGKDESESPTVLNEEYDGR